MYGGVSHSYSYRIILYPACRHDSREFDTSPQPPREKRLAYMINIFHQL